MPAARIKFTQGLVVGNAGEAMIGDAGSLVTVENGSTAGIETYQFELVDVPETSALTMGVKQGGVETRWTFTPDVIGSYGVRLTVTSRTGLISRDVRVFAVADAYGRVIPAFSCKGSAHNFAGQARGWAKYADQFLKVIQRLRDVSSSAPADGDALVWSDSSSEWVPGSPGIAGMSVVNNGTPLAGSYDALNLSSDLAATNQGGGVAGIALSSNVISILAYAAAQAAALATAATGAVWTVSGGALSFAKIVNANIDSAAAIAVTKLLGGAADQVLTSPGGTPTWAKIVNANVDSAAAVSYSKLGGSGTETLNPQQYDSAVNAKGTLSDVQPQNYQTTDGAQHVAGTFPIPNNSAVGISLLVVGIKSDYTKAVAYNILAAGRNNGGTCAQVGATQVTPLEDDSSLDATVDVSGTDFRILVTGVGSQTWQWTWAICALKVIP